MKLRAHLIRLATVAILPFAFFAAVVAMLLVLNERETFQRSAMERTRALVTAADAQLRSTVATLETLASTESLDHPNLVAFHDRAIRALRTRPDWIAIELEDLGGVQRVNTLRPPGEALPPPPAGRETATRVLETRRPAIGYVAFDALSGKQVIPVSVPVIRGERAIFALTAFVSPGSFDALLQAQQLPDGWVVGLADGRQRFVARIPSREPGSPTAPGFAAALRGAPEGWFRATTVEGKDTYQAYSRSAFSGWGVGIAFPVEDVNGTAWRTAAALVFGALFALAVAIALALRVGGRITHPLASLAAGARSIGRGESVRLDAPERVDEVARVAQALEEAAAAVKEREAALAAVNRSKDEFLATLSHELRNPLSAISMSPHLLRIQPLDPARVNQTADMLTRQSAQMSRLVEDLLDLSRITFGKITLERGPMDLGACVERLAAAWHGAGRFARHELVLDVSPAWIEADTDRIEQVLGNLVDNAVKFTPRGGRVEVSVRRDGDRAVVRVADNGPGLPPGLEDSVFETFVQGSQELHRPNGGLGIGLSVVKRFVELHGGRVTARSRPEGGAEFTLRFPALDPPAV